MPSYIRCPRPECGKRLRIQQDLGRGPRPCPACRETVELSDEEWAHSLLEVGTPEQWPELKAESRIAGLYEILEIKRGGMGVVYVCTAPQTRRKVALKTFRDEYFEDAGSVGRFVREASLWVDMGRHPNVVRAEFVLNMGDKPYILLEYVPPDAGGRNTLRHFLRGGPLRIADALGRAVQMCDGMTHCISTAPGLTHRDLKPENIMITPDGSAKITDFGLARCLLEPEMKQKEGKTKVKASAPWSPSITMVGRLGTPLYMAPECWFSARTADVRSDIYALGVILYEMLVGKPVFIAAGKKELFRHHISVKPPRPSASRSEVSRQLDAIVLKCLEKKQEARFADFAEVRAALAEAAQPLRVILPDEAETQSFTDHGEDIPLYVRGASLVNLGQYGRAVETLREARKVVADAFPVHNALGLAYYHLGRFNKAVRSYARALSAYRKPDYLRNIAVLYADTGRFDKAKALLKEAVAISPEFSPGYYNLGVAYLIQGKLEKAVESFRKAVDHTFDYASAHRVLGIVCRKLDRHDLARYHTKRYEIITAKGKGDSMRDM